MELIVPDDKLSLAIGKKGQNVRLASQLTGWRIDIHSESKVREMEARARQSLAAIERRVDGGLGAPATVEALFRRAGARRPRWRRAKPDELAACRASATSAARAGAHRGGGQGGRESSARRQAEEAARAAKEAAALAEKEADAARAPRGAPGMTATTTLRCPRRCHTGGPASAAGSGTPRPRWCGSGCVGRTGEVVVAGAARTGRGAVAASAAGLPRDGLARRTCSRARSNDASTVRGRRRNCCKRITVASA